MSQRWQIKICGGHLNGKSGKIKLTEENDKVIKVGSLICSERFFSGKGILVFPSPKKINNSKLDEEPLCGCASSKSSLLIIYFISPKKLVKIVSLLRRFPFLIHSFHLLLNYPPPPTIGERFYILSILIFFLWIYRHVYIFLLGVRYKEQTDRPRP